jgi:hypothetical protein
MLSTFGNDAVALQMSAASLSVTLGAPL